MDAHESQRCLARLALLGVPPAFHAAIARRAQFRPRGHIVLHFAVIATSILLAVLVMVGWSRYVAHKAEAAAQAAKAPLFNSDLGLESLGGFLTALVAAGWLCSWVTCCRGGEAVRSGSAYDLIHEPAKHKAIVDRAWRWIVKRNSPAARDADDFLDRLGGSMVRYLRNATLASLATTIVLAGLLPAHYSVATQSAVEDRNFLPWSTPAVHPFASATTVTAGCPVLPHDGATLIYRVGFAGEAEVELGSWHALRNNLVEALVQIATHLPQSIDRQRFSNPIRSVPLNPECLHNYAGELGKDGMARLLKLMAASEAEKASLDRPN